MAKDKFHNIVKTALIKQQWKITHDPLELKVGGVDMEIDLGAERIIAAEREGNKIAVEIKSFLSYTSAITEFHRALGQFINYRTALKLEDPNRILYLAIPSLTYNSFFKLDFPKSIVEENCLKLLIYEVTTEKILLWKN